jgi:hypothetical protein
VPLDSDCDGYTNAAEIGLGTGENPFLYCPIMRADVDGDHIVSILDLTNVAQFYTNSIPPAPQRYDQDFDNIISILDLADMGLVYTLNVQACAN